MDRKIGLLILIMFWGAGSFATDENFYSPVINQRQQVFVFDSVEGGVRLNARCAKSHRCQAFAALKKPTPKPVIVEDSKGYLLNPAVFLCFSLHAEHLILSDERSNQMDFCKFSDGSMFPVLDFFSKSKN